MKEFKCPLCKAIHTEEEWNNKTKEKLRTDDIWEISEINEEGIFVCPSCSKQVDRKYIKENVSLENQINNAIKLLRENGYIVKKPTIL